MIQLRFQFFAKKKKCKYVSKRYFSTHSSTRPYANSYLHYPLMSLFLICIDEPKVLLPVAMQVRVWILAGRRHVAYARLRRGADRQRGGGRRGWGDAGGAGPGRAEDGGGGGLAQRQGGVLVRQGGGGVVRGRVSVGAGLMGEGGGRVLMVGGGGGGGGRGGGVGEEGAPVEGGGGTRDAGRTCGRVRLLPLLGTNSRQPQLEQAVRQDFPH